MDVKQEEILQAFIAKHGDYGLSEEEVKIIITSPWKRLKKEIKSGEFNEVRFTYFGVFRPIKSKVLERMRALGHE